MKLGPYDLIKNLRWHFFQIFDMLLRWRHSGHFVCFRMRHSHGRNFALIFFKITDKKVWRLPMFAIENQQNRLITSGRKSGPRFQKIAFLVFEPVSEVPGSIPGLGKKNFNLNFSSCDREWFLLCEKHRKWLNILLTLWCSCISLLSSVNLLCDGYILIIAIFSFIKFNNRSSKTKNEFTWTSKQLSLISRQKLRTSEPQLGFTGSCKKECNTPRIL